MKLVSSVVFFSRVSHSRVASAIIVSSILNLTSNSRDVRLNDVSHYSPESAFGSNTVYGGTLVRRSRGFSVGIIFAHASRCLFGQNSLFVRFRRLAPIVVSVLLRGCLSSSLWFGDISFTSPSRGPVFVVFYFLLLC